MLTAGKVRLLFFLLSLLCLTGKDLYSQPDNAKQALQVSSFGVEQGLRQSMVSQICQDYRGLIWMVTGDGLHCFNGVGFKVFRVPYNEKENFSDNVMREVFEYTPGKFYISTTSSILQFNSSTGKFSVVVSRPGHYPRLFNVAIGGKAVCWFPGTGLGLLENGKMTPLKLKFLSPQSPANSQFPARAVKSAGGNLLIQMEQGVLEIEGNTVDGGAVSNSWWTPLNSGCQGLSTNAKGEVFLLSGNQILQYVSHSSIVSYHKLPLNTGGYLFCDSRGGFWIYDTRTMMVSKLTQDAISSFSLYTINGEHSDTLKTNVINIFEDRKGNIWFGTDGSGALLYSPSHFQFANSKIGFTRCVLQSGNFIWAGTLNHGLWQLSPDLSGARRINPTVFNDELYFLDLAMDSRDRIWAVTDKGVFLTEPSGKVQKILAFTASSGLFLPALSDKIMLVAANKLYTFSNAAIPALISESNFIQPRSLLIARETFWAASPFGLFRGSVKPGSSNPLYFTSRDRIFSTPVFCLIAVNDTIWAGTENGIVCFSGDGRKISVPPELEVLRNEVVYSMLADKYGRIWFSGNKGVGVILEGKKRLVFFNERNNLQSLEFNTNASLSTPEGWFYFGGINGLNACKPVNFNPVRKGPDARLFSITLGDAINSGGIPPEYSEVVLDRKSANISGSAFTTDYPNSGYQQFSFFLEGYQDHWSVPSTDPSFTYRNLPPGKYHLWLKCTDVYQNQGKARCVMSILVRPPFWVTWWFIVLSSLIFILAVVLIVRRIQEAKYKAMMKELERENAIEKERLRISKDMHDEVGASLTRISILSELARQQKAGGADQYIGQINEISGNVVDELSEIIWAINPRNDFAQSFSSHFRQFVSKYFDAIEIRTKIDFQEDIPDLSMSAELRRNAFLTAKEAIHNIVKHSKATEVSIKLSWISEKLCLEIKDNGQGFDPEMKKNSGNGLYNMRKRIEGMDGVFNLDSEPGKGTRVRIIIPLPKQKIPPKGDV